MKLEIEEGHNVKIEFKNNTNLTFDANLKVFLQVLKDISIDEKRYMNLDMGNHRLFICLNNVNFIYMEETK